MKRTPRPLWLRGLALTVSMSLALSFLVMRCTGRWPWQERPAPEAAAPAAPPAAPAPAAAAEPAAPGTAPPEATYMFSSKYAPVTRPDENTTLPIPGEDGFSVRGNNPGFMPPAEPAAKPAPASGQTAPAGPAPTELPRDPAYFSTSKSAIVLDTAPELVPPEPATPAPATPPAETHVMETRAPRLLFPGTKAGPVPPPAEPVPPAPPDPAAPAAAPYWSSSKSIAPLAEPITVLPADPTEFTPARQPVPESAASSAPSTPPQASLDPAFPGSPVSAWAARLPASLGVAFLSLLFLVAVFVPLERVFPAQERQPFFRKAWFTDLAFFLGQYLLFSGLVLAAVAGLDRWLDGVMPTAFRAAVAGQPLWLQGLEVVLLSDLLIYWAHRLQHRVPFLWRFHVVHHSAERLDFLAAHREHPLDSIYTVTLINLPALVLGFRLEALAGLIAFRGLWAIYIHSNVRLNLGPLRWFIGGPELHHWHHDKDKDAGNYANLSPLMDILFGTYRCPDHEPEAFGSHHPLPRTWVGHLVRPLLPARLAARFDRPAARPMIQAEPAGARPVAPSTLESA